MIRKAILPILLALSVAGCTASDKNTSDSTAATATAQAKEATKGADNLTKYKYAEYSDADSPVCEYEIEVTDSPESAVLTITNSEVDSWFRWVPIDVLHHVQEMLAEAKVDTFEHSYNDENTLDGYSWTFSADYASGEHLSSSGTNAGPRDTFMKINEYLDGVYRDAENAVKDF